MNKKRKQIISLLLAFLLVLGLAGCGENQAENHIDYNQVLTEASTALLTQAPEAGYGSVGGEWLVFGMARWESDLIEDAWYENYYETIETHVKACKGVLDARKHTEYSRVILALTAIGKNPTDVAGYNLAEPLANFEGTIFQGINGPAYALIALDSGNYEVPKVKGHGTQATREMYVDYLLSKEVEGGGWSLSGSGTADVDATAIVLQALARYQSNEDVQAAVERGVDALAGLQNEEGKYTSYDVESSESLAQVIVALTELGIDVTDARFVKDGKTLADRLLEFRAEDGGFKHTLDGESDMMATEQAFYALVGLNRVAQGMSSLFYITPIV